MLTPPIINWYKQSWKANTTLQLALYYIKTKRIAGAAKTKYMCSTFLSKKKGTCVALPSGQPSLLRSPQREQGGNRTCANMYEFCSEIRSSYYQTNQMDDVKRTDYGEHKDKSRSVEHSEVRTPHDRRQALELHGKQPILPCKLHNKPKNWAQQCEARLPTMSDR